MMMGLGKRSFPGQPTGTGTGTGGNLSFFLGGEGHGSEPF